MADDKKEQKQEQNSELKLIDLTEIISDYLRIVRRMWAWILILTLLGGALFYVRARVSYQPVYTASATFTINIQQDQQTSDTSGAASFYNNSAAEQMAKTFPYILTSGVLRRRVAKDMGTAVSGAINASVQENTNLFTISVTDQDAGRAYATLQSVIKNYPDISEVIVGKTHMEMLDETGIPAYPNNPKNFRRSAEKGAAVGFLLGALWAGILVVTRKTIRKESDIHRYMHSRCLGVIPHIHAKRRTKSEHTRIILTDPKVEEKLLESFRVVRNKIEYQAREYHMKTFLITSAMAGEGKSTIAVNLALSLAQTGKRAVLIDCDLRHPTDRHIFGLEEGPGLGEVLDGESELAECLLSSKKLGLDEQMKFLFLPGGMTKSDGSELLGTEKMRQVISRLEKWADYVILDSAPAGLLTDAVVLAQYADGAVFVVRKDFARVDYIMDGMEHLAESQIQIVGGILNGVNE